MGEIKKEKRVKVQMREEEGVSYGEFSTDIGISAAAVLATPQMYHDWGQFVSLSTTQYRSRLLSLLGEDDEDDDFYDAVEDDFKTNVGAPDVLAMS